MTPDTRFWVRCWNHYERGFLPFAGGWSDQPNRVMEAIEVLSTHIGRIRRSDRKRDDWYNSQGQGQRGTPKPVVHGISGMKRNRIIG